MCTRAPAKNEERNKEQYIARNEREEKARKNLASVEFSKNNMAGLHRSYNRINWNEDSCLLHMRWQATRNLTLTGTDEDRQDANDVERDNCQKHI